MLLAMSGRLPSDEGLGVSVADAEGRRTASLIGTGAEADGSGVDSRREEEATGCLGSGVGVAILPAAC